MGFGAILALILPFLAKLPGAAGDYFKQKQELQLEQLKTQRDVEQARQQLASELAKAQLELDKAKLNATGTKFKYFTFFMWFGPFMVGTVAPARANDIFQNWASMPDWYVQSCIVIMFTVWGISVSAPVVANIFSGLGQFMAERKDAKRDFEIQKAKINREAVFASLRNNPMFKGKGLNQDTVEMVDKALDEGEK